MDFFEYREGGLSAEKVSLSEVASAEGTPCYIYSKRAFLSRLAALREAFAEADPLICYSVKASSSLAICAALREAGAGFDIVSGGELFRALKVGADPATIVYAGVGKTEPEIEQALDAGVLLFNVESVNEARAINDVASRMGVVARIALRLNPDVDANTHSYTTTGKKENKFGIEFSQARELIEALRGLDAVDLAGFHLHLGSPISTVEPYLAGLGKLLPFIEEARSNGVDVRYINIGGGYAIEYGDNTIVDAAQYAVAIVPLVKKAGCKLIMEPGRFIIGNAGVLLTRVTYLKRTPTKTFAICDAAMNDLIRPALYGSYHRIWPAKTSLPVDAYDDPDGEGGQIVDVVGPVCESGDFLAKGRRLPELSEGDLLAVFSAGAYGMTMGSNYNSRPRPCEVLIDGAEYRVIRRRETYNDLIRGEVF